jgi:hypothetical protein
MDSQAIFDTVITHLVTQKVQSLQEWGACSYRGINGTSCAVGCLISDEDYKDEMDDNDECDSSIEYVLNHFHHLPEWMKLHRDLLSDLQRLHDTPYISFSWDITQFREEAIYIAKNHQLNYEHLINASTVSSDTL